MTKGEYRVGVSFNPSNSGSVDIIKRMAADLIDEIDAIRSEELVSSTTTAAEVGRCKALAMTAAEEAAMWAVKAVTKPEAS